jgi:hypothetical protein
VKLADMAEEVLHDDSYALTKQQLTSYREKQPLAVRVQKKLQCWDWFYDKYKKALADENCHNRWIEKQRALRAQKAEAHKRFDIESTSEEEIRGIIDKIKAQLESD